MPRILALTNGSPHSWIVMNAVVAAHGPVTVLVEPPESKLLLIRRRMRRQGIVTVLGQIGFVLLQKLVMRRSKPRIAAILTESKANPDMDSGCDLRRVSSVNAPESLAAIEALQPAVVIVFGTRMIARETLAAITVPVINFHSGINPKYRGQAGGYWALASSDPENAGVTAHLVDAGVDTGDVLYHGHFTATPEDNYSTYYYLQAAAMRPLAIQAVADALGSTLRPFKPDLPSRQFFHPTLWGYLWTGWNKGVW